jgi:hypothetical protein
MPTILIQEGYRFYFFSNEHEPIHVHVKFGAGKARFEIAEDVLLLESKGMKVQELRRAQDLVEENVELIRRKWREYFD